MVTERCGVSRSDSQHSDSSRPRVSFNRDVHVKRFGVSGNPRVAGATTGDGESHPAPLTIHREHPGRLSRREVAEKAQRILADVDNVKCISHALLDQKSNSAKKFNTLPPLRSKRHKKKTNHNFHESGVLREPHDSVDESYISVDKGEKRSLVTSLFASLDRSERNKNKKQLQSEQSLRKSKNDSSSLNDLVDSTSYENNRKRKTALKRSISDAGARRPDKYKKQGGFLSIDHLSTRKNRNKNRVVHSDTSPVYPRKNILKKSHSDSESVPLQHNVHKKKQLSPIIEVNQRDSYFQTMLHSSQLPADKPALTRGQKVDLMVKKLSQDESLTRGPPRSVTSTAVLVTPEHRQHNNNLPFSYTEPTPQPTHHSDGQVIYAEVVVSGGGSSKQTVHTKVLPTALHQEEPIRPNLHNRFTDQVKVAGSDDDEGLELTMEHRRSSLNYMEEGREYYNGGSFYKRQQEDGYWYNSSRRDDSSGLRKEHQQHITERGRADGMDARKKDLLLSERYDNHNEKLSPMPLRSTNFMSYRNVENSIDSNDLSLRRNRLESRIESQMKDRFTSTKYNTDNNMKCISNINFSARQEFLNSQLSSDRNSPYQENVKNSYIFRAPEFDSYSKKDLLADSGIEIDYRTKDSTVSNKIYENKTQSNEHLTRTFQTVNKPSTHHYQHTNDDNNETDENYNNHNIVNHNKSTYHQKTKTDNIFTSLQVSKEQRHSDAIPTSTVLIRHWVPSTTNDSKNKQLASGQNNWKKDSPPSEEEYSDYEKKTANEGIKETGKEHKKIEDKEKQIGKEKKVKNKKPTSAMDKVKQLFSRNDKSTKKSKRKDEKVKMLEDEDALRSRYVEYKGSNVQMGNEDGKYQLENDEMELDQEETSKTSHKNKRLQESSPRDQAQFRSNTILENEKVQYSPKLPHRRKNMKPMEEAGEAGSPQRNSNAAKYHQMIAGKDPNQVARQRLATPSPSSSPAPQRPYNKPTSATLNRINNAKNKEQNGSNLGGSWFKSLDRLAKRGKRIKEQETLNEYEDDSRMPRQMNSSKNLRFFGDTDQESVTSQSKRRYKANTSTGSHNRLKVPSHNIGLRHHRSAGDMATSSAESTTEGDSSQQSQRSVYLHAATVGDIPGPLKSRTAVGRRSQSREELSSTGGSSRLQPRTRTVSRSVSVLAPWKPRYYKENLELHYTNNDTSSKTLGRQTNGKPPKVPTAHHNNTMNRSSGASKYKHDGEKNNKDTLVQQKHGNKSMSVESLSQKNGQLRSQHTRNRKHMNATSVESLTHRKTRDKEIPSSNHSYFNSSTIEINNSAGKKGSEGSSQRSSSKVSRSASMPKDSRSAGWFKLRNKKQGT